MLSALAGLVALLGWLLDNRALTVLYAGPIWVKANTAIALTLIGLALALLAPIGPSRPRRAIGRTLAAIAGLIGLLTLVEHLTGFDLGIDQLFFREPPGAPATTSPNRMGPPASTMFPLLGLALILMSSRQRRARVRAQGLAMTALVLALVPLVGYLLGVRELYGIARYTGIALHTAVTFAVAAIGILLARADVGPMRLLAGEDSGGIMLRRLLPAAVLLPLVLSMLRVSGEHQGWYDVNFGRTLLVITLIVSYSAIVWMVAGVVSRHAAARLRAERAESQMRAWLELALESEREARATAERSNRLKDEFLATLSHELRTPLNAILGWSGLLRRDGTSREEQERGLEVIERNSRLQARLVDDLLDMSRILSGKLNREDRPVALPAIVEAVLAACAPAIEAGGLQLERHIDPDTPPVLGDPHRLQQMTGNLVANAIKFTPRGGHVEVTVRAAGEQVELVVRDDGSGIAPGFLPHVFDRFRQADSTTTRRHGGLGLGLAIARHVAEMHGGTIRADSAGEGLGATFTVRLPAGTAARTDAAPAPLAAGAAVSLSGVRALVVDDHDDTADMIARVLAAQGAQVKTATDAARALAMLEEGGVDVLVCDISMPGMDGYELMRRVRRHWPELPGIALTALAHAEDESRARRAGFAAYLAKPVHPGRLTATVTAVLAPQSAAPAD